MIGYLKGELKSTSENTALVVCNGVGYDIFLSKTSLAHLPHPHNPVELFIHTHVREDALQLFGFLSQNEKLFFLALQSVSGIGAKTALNMLSAMPLGDLYTSILQKDAKRLSQCPGIGLKTAQRLCVELSDRIEKLVEKPLNVKAARTPVSEQVISALVNLGYKRPDTEQALEQALGKGDNAFDFLFNGRGKT